MSELILPAEEHRDPIPDPIVLRITPHPLAPLFDGPDGPEVMRQVLALAASDHVPFENPEIREIFRQAGLVSLWFFLRVIASHSGPYDKLTNHLHVDMGNFYQWATEQPGSKAGGFIGRSHYKSTIWSHGATTWRILRNPELTVAIASAIAGRALEFLHYSQDTFERNELFRLLYPEWAVPGGRKQGWNDEMLTLPNKRRNRREPNVITITAGGSSQGIHVDHLQIDDIIGEDMLDSNRNSGADMQRMGNWLQSSIRTLTKDWKTSTVFLAGTRYATDDAYEPLLRNMRSRVGYWDGMEDYQPIDDGEWDVYYRQIEENGRIIFPEAFTREGLEKLRREDPWVFYTQYVNNPRLATNTSMGDFEVKDCAIDYSKKEGWALTFMDGNQPQTVPLTKLDVVVATDPAASDKKASSYTSRSAQVVLATDSEERRFVIGVKAGFEPITKVIDWIFEAENRNMPIRVNVLEAQGPFKLLVDVLRNEQHRRGQWLHLMPVGASGEKNARIDAQLRPLLQKGKFYAVREAKRQLEEELAVFPNGKKNDILDALSIANKASIPPRKVSKDWDEDEWDDEAEEQRRRRRNRDRSPVTGY